MCTAVFYSFPFCTEENIFEEEIEKKSTFFLIISAFLYIGFHIIYPINFAFEIIIFGRDFLE